MVTHVHIKYLEKMTTANLLINLIRRQKKKKKLHSRGVNVLSNPQTQY